MRRFWRRPHALPVAEAGPALRRLSRRGMGRAGIRRPRALREAGARRLPGRAVVDHHSAQAREFPQSLRRFRTGKDRALSQAQDRKPDEGRRHRAQPRQDRGRGAARRAAIWRSWSSGPGFSNFLWDFLDGKPKQNTFRTPRSGAGGNRHLAQDVEGACRPRLQIRRADHRLRLHAGGRHGQRPSGELPPPRGLRQARRSENEQGSEERCAARKSFKSLAAHAVGAAARSARPLPARRRGRGHRAWPGARGALERADQGRAYLFGRPARAAGRGAGAHARRHVSMPPGGARCCCTTRRNT